MTTYPITSQDEYDSFIKKLQKTIDFRGGVLVEVKKVESRRTLAQNALMWVWNKVIADHFKSAMEDVHAALKTMFLPLEIEVFGQKVQIINTTQKLSVSEFTEYLRKVEGFMIEQGINIPASKYYEQAFNERN